MLGVMSIFANNQIDQKAVDAAGSVMSQGVIFLVIFAVVIGVLGWRFINK